MKYIRYKNEENITIRRLEYESQEEYELDHQYSSIGGTTLP